MKHGMLGFIAAAALAIGSGGAFAADMAPYYRAPLPMPAFSWTGFYIGGDIGGAWTHQDVSSVCVGCNQAPGAATITASGVIGGFYGGYNLQLAPQWVVGIEGDWSWDSLSGSAAFPNLFASGGPVGSGGIAWTSDPRWLASVRGRLGWTWTPTALLYITGGAAWAGTNYTGVNAFSGGCPNCSAISFSQTKPGWVLGGGVEWAPWANSWLVRAEYLHYQFSGTTVVPTSLSPGTIPGSLTWGDMSVDEVRAGIAYKF